MCRTAGSSKSESDLKVEQPVNFISFGSVQRAPSCGPGVLDWLSMLSQSVYMKFPRCIHASGIRYSLSTIFSHVFAVHSLLSMVESKGRCFS